MSIYDEDFERDVNALAQHVYKFMREWDYELGVGGGIEFGRNSVSGGIDVEVYGRSRATLKAHYDAFSSVNEAHK
jgi:hypothetical protein